MKTIYLCGAINGCSDAECNDWRKNVEDELNEEYQFLDPMRRDFRGREDDSVSEIVEGDYADIEEADIVLVAADNPSWGTAMEMHHAFLNLHKPVVAVCGQPRISPWLRYHSTKIVASLDDAIQFLRHENGDLEVSQIEPTHKRIYNLTNTSREEYAGSFQALSALGHWHGSEPVNPERLREVLKKVQSDRFLLDICAAALEKMV